jgi:hypothetical protein
MNLIKKVSFSFNRLNVIHVLTISLALGDLFQIDILIQLQRHSNTTALTQISPTEIKLPVHLFNFQSAEIIH